jgi:hypothetical protein
VLSPTAAAYLSMEQRKTPKKELRILRKALYDLIRPLPPKTLKERVWELECEMSMMREWMCDVETERNKKD